MFGIWLLTPAVKYCKTLFQVMMAYIAGHPLHMMDVDCDPGYDMELVLAIEGI